ncbi:ABC transporter ATP-binding protein YxdL [Candidatus Bealeia paramacronuclearis]|uniref:ABC transporter ATP-binding protein YxdL n=1 Tax=Candidatus Bealeia paramacronuclearis TaxID=1921001 RepID=A0ABZ2C570_9PROT|nr:ABC transporter ATP-binding protein YxdL [Candidatus Bealeia paramacronuclearis]
MLELKNITKTFSRGLYERHTLFQNLNLSVEREEFVVILGSNGSGKSTLLKLISGVIFPDTGKVLLRGRDFASLPLFKRAGSISRVVQDSLEGTIGEFTILENLELAFYRGKRAPFFSKPPQEKFLKKLQGLPLGLEEKLNQTLITLSGGQRQVVALLMATLGTPDLLLLDEHTSALDPKSAKDVMKFTNDLVSQEKVTTLMITHNLQDAVHYGDRLIMLHHGKIVLDVKNEEKSALTLPHLLALFHDLEDQDLVGEKSHA